MIHRTRPAVFCLDCGGPLTEPGTRCRRCQSVYARRVLRAAAGARRRGDGPPLRGTGTPAADAPVADPRNSAADRAGGRLDASGIDPRLPAEPSHERSAHESAAA